MSLFIETFFGFFSAPFSKKDSSYELSEADKSALLTPVYYRVDRVILQFLLVHVLASLALSFVYDTWIFSAAVSLFLLLSYFLFVLSYRGSFFTRSLGGVYL